MRRAVWSTVSPAGVSLTGRMSATSFTFSSFSSAPTWRLSVGCDRLRALAAAE